MLKFSISTVLSFRGAHGNCSPCPEPAAKCATAAGCNDCLVLRSSNTPQGTGSISGTVVEMGSNVPIPGASVELRRIDCNNFSNPPEVFNVKTGP